MPHPIRGLRRLVREGRRTPPAGWSTPLGRIGLVGYGVVHLLVAWLAPQVAFGVPDQHPNARGAIGTIAAVRAASSPWRGAVWLLAFALWQLVAAAIGFRWVQGGERFRKRAGAVSKSIAMSGGWPC